MKTRYFPQHFRASRPYATRAFVREAIEAGQRGGHKAASDVLFRGIVAAAQRQGVAPERLLENNFLAHEVALAQSIAQLALDETPLYDMAPELVEALAHSDTGDMRLDDTRTPNRSYYLHWGPQPDLLLFGQHPVEGALVLCAHADWRIVLTTRTPYSWLLPLQRDSFGLRFPAETLSLPFEQAVDLAIQRDRETLALLQQQPMPGNKLLDASRSAAVELTLKEFALNAPVLKRALALVGNCIAYLTAYPEDERLEWQPDTPESMLAKLQRGQKERARTESKLQAMGYVQVHRVGLDFQKTVEGTRAASDQHGTVRPHWRRGHWRHQAYGERLSLRKLIWLRPMRVLGGTAGGDTLAKEEPAGGGQRV